MKEMNHKPFQLIDTIGLQEALSIFESYHGPEMYAPTPLLIRSIKTLLLERRRNESYLESNQSTHNDDVTNCEHQENLEESDHDALMQQKHDKITPENQRINDRTTSTADCNIVVESQSKTPNENSIVRRNSSGGRAWLSSTKMPRSRRKKSYTNRKKKPRHVSFGAIESSSIHGRIPSIITIDRHGGEGDNSFVFHSQSSMTDDF